MESAVGNERALAGAVTCTAEAPAALPVYNNFPFSLLRVFPRFHQSHRLHFSFASVYISATSLCISSRPLSLKALPSPSLSLPPSHSLPGLCMGK